MDEYQITVKLEQYEQGAIIGDYLLGQLVNSSSVTNRHDEMKVIC